MSEVASKSQLRMSFLRWALFVVPIIVFLGFVSGQVSGAGNDNSWYQALIKPAINPPSAVFGPVWAVLYVMIALAFSIILHARGARLRSVAIGLFCAQLVLNLVWSSVFFGMHQVSTAFVLIVVILLLSVAATAVFAKIRMSAAWLMVPYLAWLGFAAYLNFEIDRLNPGAEMLYVPAATTQI